MGNASLAGHVILIVEPAADQFVCNLQDALERVGAETLTVRKPAGALERLTTFRFSACLINYSHPSDALNALIDDLGDIPIVLYGGASAAIASTRMVARPTFAPACVDAIVSALGRLPPRH